MSASSQMKYYMFKGFCVCTKKKTFNLVCVCVCRDRVELENLKGEYTRALEEAKKEKVPSVI